MHTGKKALLAEYHFYDLKTLQQWDSIPNSAGTKKLKAINMLKQRRGNFEKKINLYIVDS